VAESFDVPAELVPRGGSGYVLRVRGDSMIEEQIRDGDYVVVEPRADARDGETVVALIRGEEATLKKLYREGPIVRLQPANAAMESIAVPAEDLEIRGVVRGLVRRY
jgi:repressor LexA